MIWNRTTFFLPNTRPTHTMIIWFNLMTVSQFRVNPPLKFMTSRETQACNTILVYVTITPNTTGLTYEIYELNIYNWSKVSSLKSEATISCSANLLWMFCLRVVTSIASPSLVFCVLEHYHYINAFLVQ